MAAILIPANLDALLTRTETTILRSRARIRRFEKSRRGPWHLARSKALSVGLSNAHFKSLGLPSLIEARSARAKRGRVMPSRGWSADRNVLEKNARLRTQSREGSGHHRLQQHALPSPYRACAIPRFRPQHQAAARRRPRRASVRRHAAGYQRDAEMFRRFAEPSPTRRVQTVHEHVIFLRLVNEFIDVSRERPLDDVARTLTEIGFPGQTHYTRYGSLRAQADNQQSSVRQAVAP